MGQNYDQNYYRNWNGGGVGSVDHQFRLDTTEEDSSGICSPPLWSTSPPQSPTPTRQNSQNGSTFRHLSPTSRAQAIARGQFEMMEMVKNMPESSYELSLKDLVEQTRLGSVEDQDFSINEERAILGSSGNGNQRWKSEKKGKVLISGSRISIDHQNRGMLLKMGYVPFFLGSNKKKKVLVTNTCAKVSPKPHEVQFMNEKSGKINNNVDHQRDWWKKKLSSVPSESESGEGSSHSGSTIRSGSIGSNSGSSRSGSSRSNSSNSRRNSGCRVAGCWPFFRSKKHKYAK